MYVYYLVSCICSWQAFLARLPSFNFHVYDSQVCLIGHSFFAFSAAIPFFFAVSAHHIFLLRV